ncbi:amino acid ABC transporter substrate-binding protein [Rhodospirillum sp. A1_3_36]|uniref:amino acid ABC transporter substrate-binding protein n=1 Tax=Rhodospirillum sp. A1_3_36 TaxID=3391666 RepID=UPI0039A73C8A
MGRFGSVGQLSLAALISLGLLWANGMAWAQTIADGDALSAGMTVEAIKDRGLLKCGVNVGLAGMSSVDPQGNWVGFDADFCRAVAAGVLGDGELVEFVPLSASVRLQALTEGAVDLLARNTTWTLKRDAGMGLSFPGVSVYDGQGLLVWNSTPGEKAKDLPAGTRVCLQSNTTTARNIEDVIKARNLPLVPVFHNNLNDARAGFFQMECQAYTGDRTALASLVMAEAPRARDIRILPDVLSKEPLGPVVREGDDRWFDIVRWTLNALIQAEEYGLTRANVDQVAAKASNPPLRRFLGEDPGVGASLGLDDHWVRRVISQVGSYGEIFQKNLGDESPLRLDRGLNKLWTEGGLLYSPPFL